VIYQVYNCPGFFMYLSDKGRYSHALVRPGELNAALPHSERGSNHQFACASSCRDPLLSDVQLAPCGHHWPPSASVPSQRVLHPAVLPQEHSETSVEEG
jgi:hypothetical protein